MYRLTTCGINGCQRIHGIEVVRTSRTGRQRKPLGGAGSGVLSEASRRLPLSAVAASTPACSPAPVPPSGPPARRHTPNSARSGRRLSPDDGNAVVRPPLGALGPTG